MLSHGVGSKEGAWMFFFFWFAFFFFTPFVHQVLPSFDCRRSRLSWGVFFLFPVQSLHSFSVWPDVTLATDESPQQASTPAKNQRNEAERKRGNRTERILGSLRLPAGQRCVFLSDGSTATPDHTRHARTFPPLWCKSVSRLYGVCVCVCLEGLSFTGLCEYCEGGRRGPEGWDEGGMDAFNSSSDIPMELDRAYE